jgi:hypothetical protein
VCWKLKCLLCRPARELWTPEYLRQNIDTFRLVYYRNTETNHTLPPSSSAPSSTVMSAAGRVFGPVHYHTQPMNELQSVRWRNPHNKLNLSSALFFDKVQRNSQRHQTLSTAQLTRFQTQRSTQSQSDANAEAEAQAQAADSSDDLRRGEFLYYVNHLEHLSESGGSRRAREQLLDAVEPLQPFALTAQTQVNVWIGQAGVWAHMHCKLLCCWDVCKW